jgi:hypothetical protein
VKQHERVASQEVIARMRRLLRRLSTRRHVRHAVVAVESVDGAWAWRDAAGEATPEGLPMRAATPCCWPASPSTGRAQPARGRGTVDQASAVTVPFRRVPNALAGLAA